MSNPIFNVTQTIQSPGNEPVEIKWASGTDALGVMRSVVNALETDTDSSVPASVRPVLLGISVTRMVTIDEFDSLNPGLPDLTAGEDDPCLVCQVCGEAFDSLESANGHQVAEYEDDKCPMEGYDILSRKQAF